MLTKSTFLTIPPRKFPSFLRFFFIVFLVLSFTTQNIIQAQVYTQIIGEQEKIYDYIPWYFIKQTDTIMVTPVNIDSVLTDDELNGSGGSRFAVKSTMNLTIEDGTFHDFINYSIWRMPVYSPNAKSLSFLFENLNLPEGSQMYIYCTDNKIIHGPIESKNVHDGIYYSDALTGDFATIEVFLFDEIKDEFSIEIPNVDHGIDLLEFEERGIGTSASCNVNVICPQGAGMEDEINTVCLIYNNNDEHCTGTLINTECNNLRPFILTAKHCLTGGSDYSHFGFKFNYESTSCNANLLGTTIWFSGATLRSSFTDTDFALLELMDPISSLPNMSYAGWDRSGTLGANTTILHHPDGDLKKITFDAAAPIVSTEERTFFGSSLFTIPSGNALEISLSDGIGGDFGNAEGGSSGAAYFDSNKRIVAQHIGGDEFDCSTTGMKFGGRFSISWTGGGTNSTRLSNWLGGINNPMTVNTIKAPYITGDDFLCFSDGDMAYVLENSLSGHTVSWSVSPTSFFDSGTSGTGTSAVLSVKDGVVKGEATLTFTMTNTETTECGDQTITKTIWVGKPTTPVIQALPCFSPGTNVAFIVSADGADTYDWTFPICPNGPVINGDPDPECWFNYNSNSPSNTTILVYVGEQDGNISVSATNKCGTTYSSILPIEFCEFPVPGEGPNIRSSSDEEAKEKDELKDFSATSSKIYAYPNPATDILNIVLDDEYYLKKESKDLQIINVNGISVYQSTNSENDFKIDVSEIPSGIYYLKVQYEDRVDFQKIIIL